MMNRCAAWRSDNFVVGFTDVSPTVTAPTLWNYDALCGQYPGVVGVGTTVHLQCNSSVTEAYRYLIVQFPISGSSSAADFCELEVYIRRKFTYR